MNNYIARENKVRRGESKVFKNWNAKGVTLEKFLAGLKWVCEDPKRDYGNGKIRMTRELGCTNQGELIRLRRVCDELGEFVGFYTDEKLGSFWSGPSINCQDCI